MEDLSKKSDSDHIPPDKPELFLSKADSPKPESEKQSGSAKTNFLIGESRSNSETEPAHNSLRLTRFAREIKRIVQELILINEPDHSQHHNLPLSAIKQAPHSTTAYSQQPKPKERSHGKHNKNKRIEPPAILEPGGEPEVPKDIMERSFKNPNFFSSHLLKHRSKSMEDESPVRPVEREQERINPGSELQTDSEPKTTSDDRTGQEVQVTFLDFAETPHLKNPPLIEKNNDLKTHGNPVSEEADKNCHDNAADSAVNSSDQRPHQKPMRPAESLLHKLSRETGSGNRKHNTY
ncbi:hypothetical protein AMJ80_10595 [bacterium SM23_31]|nr:MAG: hypothetical protein AMJ80_10595 [bacterium SM23_31]